jgi:hypothetical protein
VDVTYEALDPHTVRITARSPAGRLVVLDAFHPDWTAEDGSVPVPIERVLGRYRAVATPGGSRVFTFRFRPRWRAPALGLCALGVVLAVTLAVRR